MLHVGECGVKFFGCEVRKGKNRLLKFYRLNACSCWSYCLSIDIPPECSAGF
ncbi:hypothetical protein [Rubritalea tangerina]|uniref:hypothetical protein n=1 Tax=Rubritalea tangerina TaxID=430798 RepID=UPI00360CA323